METGSTPGYEDCTVCRNDGAGTWTVHVSTDDIRGAGTWTVHVSTGDIREKSIGIVERVNNSVYRVYH